MGNVKQHHVVILMALVSVIVAGCPPMPGPPPPTDFGITIHTITTSTGGELQITGHAFTPGGTLKIAYANIPNRPGSVPAGGPLPLVLGDGTFFYGEAFNCTSHDAGEQNVLVFVSVTDVNTGHFATANVKAGSIWVHPELPSCQ